MSDSKPHISPDQLEHYFDILFASRDNGRLEEAREYERNICTSYQDLFEQYGTLHAAATAMADFLWHEKQSDEPPKALLDKGYVSMVRSWSYEREEQLGEKLLIALGRDPNETSSPASEPESA